MAEEPLEDPQEVFRLLRSWVALALEFDQEREKFHFDLQSIQELTGCTPAAALDAFALLVDFFAEDPAESTS